jgi:hypothetical protein
MKKNVWTVAMAAIAWMAWSQVTWAQTAATKAAATQPASAPATMASASAAETSAAAEPVDPLEDFIAKSKHPVSWLSWGADARLREEYFDNAISLNQHAPNHEYDFHRWRERLWATVTPVENLDFNARLVYEPRYYVQPDPKEGLANDEALFDNLNVSYKKAFGLPVTITVGRQDIILGDGWLVLEGTPEDGSRTIFFDAVRTTWDLKTIGTTVDAIYIDQDARSDRGIENICDKEVPLRSDDERGAILYVRNQSIQNTKLDGYFIYKKDMIPDRDGWPAFNSVVSDRADLYTYGGRAEYQFDEHWNAHAELAEQLGHKNMRDVCALGFTSLLTYSFKDKMDNQLHGGYEFLSGDDPSTGKDEQFNLVWGRYPQWSELYVYTYVKETRIADVTNLHRINVVGWVVKPTTPLQFNADYHVLFADENTRAGRPGFSENGCFRGNLLTSRLTYVFTPHITGQLVGEMFVPGNYYSDSMSDIAYYARYELIFKW